MIRTQYVNGGFYIASRRDTDGDREVMLTLESDLTDADFDRAPYMTAESLRETAGYLIALAEKMERERAVEEESPL